MKRRKQHYVPRRIKNRLTKERYDDLMDGAVCTVCGESRRPVLEWHHLDPRLKRGNVSSLVHRGASWEVVQREIENAVVVCANCHKMLEHERRQQSRHNGRQLPLEGMDK
jgi:hypothetical protein